MYRLRRFLFYLQGFVTAIVIDHCISFCMLMNSFRIFIGQELLYNTHAQMT